MKARFKRTRTSDGLPLLAGKIYDVLDIKCGRDRDIEKIRVKNEKGEEEWYKANKFLLFGEAAEHVSKNADEIAQQMESLLHVGIDFAKGADMTQYIDLTAAKMSKNQTRSGKAVIKGLMDGLGIEYGE